MEVCWGADERRDPGSTIEANVFQATVMLQWWAKELGVGVERRRFAAARLVEARHVPQLLDADGCGDDPEGRHTHAGGDHGRADGSRRPPRRQGRSRQGRRWQGRRRKGRK
eukprot:1966860-Prymnesium_polylepis.1